MGAMIMTRVLTMLMATVAFVVAIQAVEAAEPMRHTFDDLNPETVDRWKDHFGQEGRLQDEAAVIRVVNDQGMAAAKQAPYTFRRKELPVGEPIRPGIHVARDGELVGKLVFFNQDGMMVPLRAFGVNYYDAFTRYLKDENDRSFVDGFAYLQAHETPVCRVLAAGFWPIEWRLYFSDQNEYFRRLDHFFAEAEAHGIGVIVTLFWNGTTIGEVVQQAVLAGVLEPGVDFTPNDPLHLDKNGDPTYAEYSTDLGREDSGSIAWIRHYTRQVVERYADSSAVWGWEFSNEINNMVDHPNVEAMRRRAGSIRHQGMHLPETTKDREVLPLWTGPDDLTRAHVRVAKRIFAETVRSVDPGRFIKSGDSRPRAQAYHNWTEHSWRADNRQQNHAVMPIDNPPPMDTVTVHVYPGNPSDVPTMYFPEDDPIVIRWLTGQYRELLEHYKRGADALQQPLILGEFGVPGNGTTKAERLTYHRFLQAIIDAEIQLSLLWTFDDRNPALTDWHIHTGDDPDWPATPKLYQIANDNPELWDLRTANRLFGSLPQVR
jgi:hypothetical protein